jgi:hypothetical protein
VVSAQRSGGDILPELTDVDQLAVVADAEN